MEAAGPDLMAAFRRFQAGGKPLKIPASLMSIFRVIIILAVVGLIVGGASYFAYDLYWKPKMLDKKDREEQERFVRGAV